MNTNAVYQKFLIISVIVILMLSSVVAVAVPAIARGLKQDTRDIEIANEGRDEGYQIIIKPQEQPITQHGAERGVRVDVDVGIDGVGDVTGITSPEHFPGQSITLNCTVRNYLNKSIPQAFEVLFTIDDNVEDIPGYHYQDNQTVLPSQLPGNGTINMTWNWTPPLHAPPGSSWNFSEGDHTFTAIFTTIYDGDINSNNNQMKLDVIIKKPDFVIKLKSGWGENNPEPIKTITIVPGTVTKFPLNFTVFNKGKETWIDFNISVPTKWEGSNPPPKFFQSNSNSTNDNLSLILFPSIIREYSPCQKELPITLKATCRRYPFATNILVFYAKIAFIPYPDIKPPNTLSAQPGDVYVDFTVVNDGNGQDSFRAEASAGQTPFEKQKLDEQGWKAIVHSGKYSPVLERGGEHTVRVKVTVPPTVPAGAPCLINLTVYSEKATEFACQNHPYAIKNGFFYLYSSKKKNVDVQDSIATIDMKPNSEATVGFTIRNTGNGVDNTITCNITDAPEGWKTTLDISDIPFLGLGRQAVADIELTIKTPKEVTVGIYTIKVAGIAENEIKDESEIKIDIQKVRKIDLLCKEPTNYGNVSERLEFVISVRNQGNSKDSVDLSKTLITENMKEDWADPKLSKTFVSLYPYQSSDVILTVDIPIDALADTNPATHAQVEPYEIEVKGVSQNDTSIKDIFTISVYVQPIYNFKFSKESETIEIISGKLTFIDYPIEIQNLGNTWDDIEINYEGAVEDFYTSIPFHKRLPPGQLEYLLFSLESPANVVTGDYSFKITGTSSGDKSLEHTIEIIIKVITSDLTISDIKFDGKSINELGKVKPDKTLLISVDISNIGDLRYLNTTYGKIFIEFYEEKNYIGDRNITYLPTEAYDAEKSVVTVSISWTVGKQDSYAIIIKLDPEGNFPESDTSNNIRSETVNVDLTGTGDTTAVKKTDNSELTMIFLLIIVLIVILIVGLRITFSSFKKAQRAGYTEGGEYKPYEEREEITFDKDGDDIEIPSDHPYKLKGDKLGGLTIIKTQPIRKTKPITRIKPIGEVKPLSTTKPFGELPRGDSGAAGFLPPHDEDSGEDS